MDGPLMPVDQVVLKVHSRCDLACDHCYVYESADQSWRGRPLVMSDAVASQAARRIAEHVTRHGLGRVEVVLHGGEPLLAGAARLRRIITTLDDALGNICQLDLRVHTNGVLLDEEICSLFAEYGVSVGISIDGDRAANDRHRRFRDGRSSYGKVVRAIGLIRTGRFRHLYGGLLCTIDTANDPVAVYDALVALRPPRIDFLLPHATWDDPPARDLAADSQYADWLIAIFDRWQAAGYPVRIRTFESVMSTLAGGQSQTEALGLAPSRLVVIETDGAYEQVDSLKVAFDGAPATGLDVFRHSLDLVGQHAGIAARQQGLGGLCQACQECPVVSSCGGGLYTHRYRSGTGFANPSVYCADLLKLITHIRRRLPHLAGRSMNATLVMSEPAFTELARGLGGAEAMAQLAEAQRTLQRALLAAVYQSGSTAPFVADEIRAQLHAAWGVLARADRRQPASVDAVLSHPYLRVWAVRCLEGLKRAGGAPPAGLEADLGHLGAVAASIAIRCSEDAELAVPVIDGAVHLPGFGRLVVARKAGPAHLVIDTDSVSLQLKESCWKLSVADLLRGESRVDMAGSWPGGQEHTAQWQPVRMLEAPGIRVAIEDTDPYRDCHQWPAASRLDGTEFGRWQRYFAAAWHEIQTSHPAYGPAIASGLRALMPLSPGPDGREVSAAARNAFGAIGLALPDDPVALALLIIHEFQHVKLGAVLDLYDLYDPADRQLYHAPWREDLRPLEGLLQGTYAHLAVTEFWRVRGLPPACDVPAREVPAGNAAAEDANRRFVHWRDHTRDAIKTLADSGSLTPLGMRFVNEMRDSITANGDFH